MCWIYQNRATSARLTVERLKPDKTKCEQYASQGPASSDRAKLESMNERWRNESSNGRCQSLGSSSVSIESPSTSIGSPHEDPLSSPKRLFINAYQFPLCTIFFDIFFGNMLSTLNEWEVIFQRELVPVRRDKLPTKEAEAKGKLPTKQRGAKLRKT